MGGVVFMGNLRTCLWPTLVLCSRFSIRELQAAWLLSVCSRLHPMCQRARVLV